MRIAHVSDLHLGRSLHNFSLIEDQRFILNQIVGIAEEKKIEAMVVAGDVYDKSIASVEGINLLKEFLEKLVKAKIKVLLISGNHDSAERLTFGGKFMTESGIYFSEVYGGHIEPVVLEDEYGPVNFYLLPFIKPASVKPYLEGAEINSYEDALKAVINEMHINKNERNICVAHQNILNAERSDSEEAAIGGVDSVSSAVFEGFDYTALGHIHKAQNVGKNVRYCGTPLKYSISEMNNEKSVTILNIEEKGKISFETVPLKPLREMRRITGTFGEITENAKKSGKVSEDFIDMVLTDENEELNAMDKLRSYYPNILQLTYDNTLTRNEADPENLANIKNENPLELFEEFYEHFRGTKLEAEQKDYISELIEKIWGGR